MLGKTPIPLPELTQLTVADALADADLSPPLPGCGVVVGSSRGCQGIWEQFARQKQAGLADSLPNLANFLPHQAAIEAARLVGSQQPVLAPMAACATGIWSLAQGMELIWQNRCQRVLAGAVEAAITPLTLAGFRRMGALATTGCYPFARQREGLVLGEGGAIFLLERAELARQRGAKIYGQLLGFGLTCDACHVSAPAPNQRSVILAIKQCLERSHLQVGDIDYLHPHGTATLLNDSREAALFAQMFPGLPISSTKGATGHTLGASGALGVAFCLLALQHQQLPPNVGWREPEFDLDLVRVARQQVIRNALCFSFGFGGQNGIISVGNVVGPS